MQREAGIANVVAATVSGGMQRTWIHRHSELQALNSVQKFASANFFPSARDQRLET